MHFVKPGLFLKIVPPMLPYPLLLVYLTGLLELTGAAGMLIPTWQRFAAYGLVVLLVVVFPANIRTGLTYPRGRA